MTAFQQTHIAVVLDRSGSMDACRKQTVDALNKYIQELRGDVNTKEADLSIIQFDTQAIEEMRRQAPVNMKDLGLEDFVPRGGTPLFDAIGRGISRLEDTTKASGSTKAILVILTDGQENASRKHTHESITALIKQKQDAGWLVVFLGAGLDVAKIGVSLGVNMNYAATADFMNAGAMRSLSGAIGSTSSSYAANATGAQAKQWMASGGGAFTDKQRLRMSAGKSGSKADLTKGVPAAPAASPVAFSGSVDAWVSSGQNDAQDDAWGR